MELLPVAIGVFANRLHRCELIVTKPDQDWHHSIECLGIHDAAQMNIPTAIMVRKSPCKAMRWMGPPSARLELVRPGRPNNFASCVEPLLVCAIDPAGYVASLVGAATQTHTDEHKVLI